MMKPIEKLKLRMMQTIKYLKLAVVMSAVIFGLSACETPVGKSDYRATHKNIVSTETISLEISGDLEDELQGELFKQVIREFNIRSAGPMAIEVNRFGVSDADVATKIQIINRALRDAGIHERQIIILPTPAGNGLKAAISFTANKVEAAECGDWSTGSSFNWENAPQANFGCSIQRNLGLMVANPGDLIKAQTGSNIVYGELGSVFTPEEEAQ